MLAGVVATEVPAERLAAGREAGRAGAPAERLAAVARDAGIGWVEEVVDPAAAVDRARSVARAQGGVVLVTGSHYLLRYAGDSTEWRVGPVSGVNLPLDAVTADQPR